MDTKILFLKKFFPEFLKNKSLSSELQNPLTKIHWIPISIYSQKVSESEANGSYPEIAERF
jgi:hypothetical protein